MSMLHTTRYPVSHPMLRKLIKYYWVIQSKSSIEISHKLLPVSNVDFILNFSSPIRYSKDGKMAIEPAGIHFNGIRDKYYMISQTGVLRVFGISFYSTGLFPVLKMPMSEFKDKTIEVDLIIKGFSERIADKVSTIDSIPEIIKIIEEQLLEIVDTSLIPRKEIYKTIEVFCKNINDLSINSLCEEHGINQRRLERIFNKYIGISPKLFYRINRFQEIVNHIEKTNNGSFTSFAYNNNYYDQPHFIKDFKSFTGSTPTEFLKGKKSVVQITKYC